MTLRLLSLSLSLQLVVAEISVHSFEEYVSDAEPGSARFPILKLWERKAGEIHVRKALTLLWGVAPTVKPFLGPDCGQGFVRVVDLDLWRAGKLA